MNIIAKLISQLNESIDISKIPTRVIPEFIPKEKWQLAFNDITERHGKSKFGSMTVNDMFKDSSNGWFFHYSSYKNKYFEGQYSFQFVQTFGFKDLRVKNIVSDSDVSWNHGNFMVDSINKQIVIEKAWMRDRLAPGQIENMDEVKIALSIAANLHPEIINYKFSYPRMGLKKVSDVLNISSIGEGDSDIFMFWGTTEDGLRIANKSKRENITCWFDTKLAKGEIRVYQSQHPAETGEAIVKLKFKSNDNRLTKNRDGSVDVTFITKSDIVSYKTSKDFDINKKILYKKFDKYKFLEDFPIYKVDDWENFKSNYQNGYKSFKGKWKNNFIKMDYIYEVVNNEQVFLATTSEISDNEIIFSLCRRNPNIFSLRSLNIVDWSDEHEIISEFILNKNINLIIKIFFDNLFADQYKGKENHINIFIERIQEFLLKG